MRVPAAGREVVASLALLFAVHILTAPAALAKPVRPERLSAAERDSLARLIEQGRAEDNEALRTSPTSYLATVRRVDYLRRSTLVVGSAADCDVRIEDPGMPAHALRATVVGDSFHVEALDPVGVVTAGHDAVRDVVLPPSMLRVGRWSVRLSHQRYPAIIVFDPKSPRFADYKPMPWFPVNFAYRFVAPLVPDPKADTVVILSTRGNERRALRVGWFDLLVGGKPCRFEAQRLLEPGVDENSISIFFRDATTGRESYGVGRYLDPEPLGDGRWLLDFNLAYNPACAFSDHYNCPIPTRSNTVAVAIRAGARNPHMAGH
ncbi:MAG: DUF1684 domain-containing protein [Candidatus Eisenbacteria bacterium]|nr:DUF1684 domain-containing protein [Candidatus Eisenbacteria bacterium]